jgi:hypothetical protein
MTDTTSEYDRALRILGPIFVSKVVAKLRELLIENMKAESQVSLPFRSSPVSISSVLDC